MVGTLRYGLQKDVAGGPNFLSTVSAKFTALQSTPFGTCGRVGSAEITEVLRTPATAINDKKCMMKRPDRCIRNCVEVMMGL